MGWRQVEFPLLVITPSGGFTGLFVYNGAPAAGNLIASITAANGTDPFGNFFEQGLTSYNGAFATGLAVQIFSNVVNFWKAGSANANLGYDSPNNIIALRAIGGIAKIALNDASNNDRGILIDPASPLHVLVSPHILTVGRLTAAMLELQGTLALQNAAAPASVAGFAQPFASSGALEVVDGTDGVTYDTERLTALIAAQTITSATTLATLTVAARAYEFEAMILSQNTVAADAMDLALALGGGAAVASFGLEYTARSIAAGAVTETGAIPTAITGVFTTSNANANRQSCAIRGQVTFSAGGTLSLTANEHVAGNTISVFPSKMTLYPVT